MNDYLTRTRAVVPFACAVLIFTALGCGGGGSGDEDTTTDPDTVSDTTDTSVDTDAADTADDTDATDTADDTGATDTPGDTAGDSDSPDTTGDTDEDGDPTCDPAPTSCNSLVPGSSLVPEIRVAAAAPALTGGTLRLGTYNLTSSTFYTGPGGATGPSGVERSIKFTFTASTWERAGVISGPAECSEEEVNGSYSSAANQMTISFTCPEVGSGPTFPYQANSTTFIMELEAGSVETYTIE